MTGPDTPPNVSQDNVIASALSPMQVVAEAVVGYHRKLIDGGVSSESAGRMAEEFHTTLMDAMMSKIIPRSVVKRKDHR